MKKQTKEFRSIAVIANEIRNDWKPVNFAAKPYLEAMQSLDKVTDSFGVESPKSIILYFLCNASQWRGEKARAIKKELNEMAK